MKRTSHSVETSDFIVESNGAEINSTSYWRTALAHAGLPFLTYRSGAYRLLVPAAAVEVRDALDEVTELLIGVWRGPTAPCVNLVVQYPNDECRYIGMPNGLVSIDWTMTPEASTPFLVYGQGTGEQVVFLRWIIARHHAPLGQLSSEQALAIAEDLLQETQKRR